MGGGEGGGEERGRGRRKGEEGREEDGFIQKRRQRSLLLLGEHS